MARQEDDGRRVPASPPNARAWRAEAIGLIVIVVLIFLFILVRGGVNWGAR
jgi:hypothetical protein